MRKPQRKAQWSSCIMQILVNICEKAPRHLLDQKSVSYNDKSDYTQYYSKITVSCGQELRSTHTAIIFAQINNVLLNL